jgi:hypothetical protein
MTKPPFKPGEYQPDDTSDEIVDMTPANALHEDSDDSDDMEDMAPMTPMTPMTPMMPMVPQMDESSEGEDMAAPGVPEDEPVEAVAWSSSSTRERTLANRGARSSSLRAQVRRTEEPGDEQPSDEQPKTGGKRLRTIILTLLVIVALVYVGHKVLGSSLGSRALGLVGGNTGGQSTPAQVTTVPTPKTVQIGNQKVTTAVGPLILLNPGVVRQGTAFNVTGSGFDPGSVVELSIVRQGSSTPLASVLVKADKSGGFYSVSMTAPTSLSAGNFSVVAQERNSSNSAQSFGAVAGGAPQVKLGPQVGQPGAQVTVSLNGFAPMETIKVYWNSLGGQPVATFQADGGGGVGQGHIRVPYGAVGENTFLFVGAKSLSMVAANFLMLNLYPTVKLSSYALKADNMISFTGKGFGPGEPVLVFLNSTQSQPLAVVTADNTGAFKNAAGFVIPYVLKGKQTLIFMGEQSRAPETVSFTVLPYSPLIEPSTYGGLPGTAISFYVSGFAPSEIVHVYAGHTKSTTGNMVACFQTDGQGRAVNVGSYVIPGSAQGALGFALIGEKSGGVGTASVNVTAPPAPVQTPPQAPFTCPLDQPAQPSQSGKPSQQPPAGATPAGQQGSIGLPGQPEAAESSAVSTVTSTMPVDADLAMVVTTAAGRLQPWNAQVSAQSAEGSGTRRPPVGRGSPSSAVYGALGYLGSVSIVDGVALLWVIVVVILTCILIRRSYRLEIASPPYAGNGEPRGKLGRVRETVASLDREPPLATEQRVLHDRTGRAELLLAQYLASVPSDIGRLLKAGNSESACPPITPPATWLSHGMIGSTRHYGQISNHGESWPGAAASFRRDQAFMHVPYSLWGNRTLFDLVRCIPSDQFRGRRHSNDARSHGRSRFTRPQAQKHRGGLWGLWGGSGSR